MGGDLDEQSSPIEFPYTKLFNELFPSYLAIGMTYELYWDNDPSLAKSYKKAFMLTRQEENFKLWLQGGYMTQAILSTVGNMFSKDSKFEYPKQPFSLNEKVEKKENMKEKEKFNKGLNYMLTMMNRGGKNVDNN